MTEPEPDKQDVATDDSDSDPDDGDTVISRGWPRNPANLKRHGLRPVWTSQDGYPDTPIPSDIMEYLDEDKTRTGAWFVGPLKSLAWLAGLDELVEACDSPAFTIEDTIEVVPFGAELMWPIEWHIEQNRISSRIADRVFPDRPWAKLHDIPAPVQEGCPEGVKDVPTLFPLNEITGASRLQRPAGQILCARIKSNKNLNILERQIDLMMDGMAQSSQLWFRALSVPALKSTLALFVPQTSGNNSDNEFGPGFYTTKSLGHSLNYLRDGVGAVMVFKDPALTGTSVWQPDLQEWEAWVSRWLARSLEIARQPAPSEYNTADFILGAIGDSQPKRRRVRRQVPVQSDRTQLVAVSCHGCQKLADSLHLVIFVEAK
ncbi:unnamed protein product [Penicillium bialowiezense]